METNKKTDKKVQAITKELDFKHVFAQNGIEVMKSKQKLPKFNYQTMDGKIHHISDSKNKFIDSYFQIERKCLLRNLTTLSSVKQTVRFFREAFDSQLKTKEADFEEAELDDINFEISCAMKSAASSSLIPLSARPRKPWVSQHSLDLILKRNTARKMGNSELEKRFSKLITKSIADE